VEPAFFLWIHHAEEVVVNTSPHSSSTPLHHA